MVKSRLLVTGGSGRLGRELTPLLRGNLFAPTHREMDITVYDSVTRYFQQVKPEIVVHLAAYTNVVEAEQHQDECWHCNVEGTRNVVESASTLQAQLVHISSDYVFSGDHGDYSEEDSTGPPCNYYAHTKIAAEKIVRQYDRSLIIRCSFRARKWPHSLAFEDVYTSQDYVDIIAPRIAATVHALDRIQHAVLHIGTPRKSSYDLARRRKHDVMPASRAQAATRIPADSSLNTSRWDALHLEILS